MKKYLTTCLNIALIFLMQTELWAQAPEQTNASSENLLPVDKIPRFLPPGVVASPTGFFYYCREEPLNLTDPRQAKLQPKPADLTECPVGKFAIKYFLWMGGPAQTQGPIVPEEPQPELDSEKSFENSQPQTASTANPPT